MLLGVIADDFTGASDIAAMLSRGGMRTELFIGTPDVGSNAEAGVVGLKSRSIASAEAVRQSLGVLDWLRGRGCEQIVFKYCSTFDSTPRGNIGPVAEALARALDVRGVVVCPALPENGRTLYMGHLFVKDRLLNESGLEKHPLNPMTDPDIRRWLAGQCTGEVGLVPMPVVARGAAAIGDALAAADETLVVVDAIEESNLRAIGEAVAAAPLVTGAAGVAVGLPDNYRWRGRLNGSVASLPGVDAPAIVLSGSCSPATRQQIKRYRETHPSLAVDVEALMTADDALAAELLDFAGRHRDEAPLIYSSAEPDAVAADQRRYGRDELAIAIEVFFGRLARSLVEAGFHRLVVAGGETSGAVVSALGIKRFLLGPEIDPGVPALVTEGNDRLAVALKSGNFGGLDFFERALTVLAGGRA